MENFISDNDNLIDDLTNTPDSGVIEETEFKEDEIKNDFENETENNEFKEENFKKNNPLADIAANINVLILPILTQKILNYFNRETKITIDYDIKGELKENYEILLDNEFINSLSPKERAIFSILLINVSFVGTAFILSEEKKKNENENTKNESENIYSNDESSQNIIIPDENFNIKKKRGRPRKNKIIEI